MPVVLTFDDLTILLTLVRREVRAARAEYGSAATLGHRYRHLVLLTAKLRAMVDDLPSP